MHVNDFLHTMADEQREIQVVTAKTDGGVKEPQKFVYVQLQQDRSGEGVNVAKLVPSRNAGAAPQFIPLASKVNTLSLTPRPSITTVTVATRTPSATNRTTATSLATTRPVVASSITVSNSHPVVATPITTTMITPATATMLRASTNMTMASNPGLHSSLSPGGSSITLLGSGASLSGNTAAAVIRSQATAVGGTTMPSGFVGVPSDQRPVILHTPNATGKVVSPRLVPVNIPVTQVRVGGSSKTVLSYSAIIHAGSAGKKEGGSGGTSGVGVVGTPSQPLVLHTSQPLKGSGMPKPPTAAIPINIITGKGSGSGAAPPPAGSMSPMNLMSVNLNQGSVKTNMINFKIANGQIQSTDSLPKADVLREARPITLEKKMAVREGTVVEEHTDTDSAEEFSQEALSSRPSSGKKGQQSKDDSEVEEEEERNSSHDDILEKAVNALGRDLQSELEQSKVEDEEEEEEEEEDHKESITPAVEEAQVKTEVKDLWEKCPSPKVEPKVEDQKLTPKTEDIKFSEVLKWEDGIGNLAGSKLKFRLNEFNVVEIIEDHAVDDIKSHVIKRPDNAAQRHSRKPNHKDQTIKDEEIFSDNSQDVDVNSKMMRDADEICCCKNCGCYGLHSEFYRDGSFCSQLCGEEHDIRDQEYEKEKERQREKDERIRQRQKQRRLKHGENGEEGLLEDGGEGEDVDNSGLPLGSDEDSQQSPMHQVDAMGNERFRHPWQTGKTNFSWAKYLEHCGRAKGQAKAAPLKLWPEPFPYSRNLFKVGMKLEGIDPEHQSLFCVLTVADTHGHRVKLHFDGYSEQHDFWVNASSPNLFPVGWCEKNGKQLESPPGVTGFNWPAYLKHCKAQAAPRQAFVCSKSSTITPPNNFRVGMKLEAEDRRNACVCVATVVDGLDNRVLIHFDGWNKAYDFWAEISSPYIHPVGWCSENSVALHPPKDYPNPESFNWHEYLQETNSSSVPARAFKTRPPREFKSRMKLEVVDRRNPSLIRVATVVTVRDYSILIHFDGWGDEYDYWVDDDSPDIHPPSWCGKVGHLLQPPLTPEQTAEDVDAGTGCGTPGCKGVGHIKGPIYTTHHTAYGCPYSPQNLNKFPDQIIPDRLQPPPEKKKGKGILNKVKLDLSIDGTSKEIANDAEDEVQKKRIRKRRKFFDELSPPEHTRTKLPRTNSEDSKVAVSVASVSQAAFSTATSLSSTSSTVVSGGLELAKAQEEPSVDTMVHQSVFNPGYHPNPLPPAPPTWEKHRHLTASLGGAKRSDVVEWTPQQVQHMVAKIPGCERVAKVFVEQQIDGEAFVMMTQNDLVKLLNIKLGPAIKLMAVIMCLRNG